MRVSRIMRAVSARNISPVMGVFQISESARLRSR